MKTKLLITMLLFWFCLSNNSSAQSKLTAPSFFSNINYRQEIKNNTAIHRSSVQKNDSIYYWTWDTLNNVWNLKFKLINIVYDSHDNKLSTLCQNWIANKWVNSYKYENTYDVNNNNTSGILQNWNGSAWENASYHNYTYDSNNNLTGSLTQNWFNNNWVNVYKETYTYDANNNQTKFLDQQWNNINWTNKRKDSMIYDSNNNKIFHQVFDWYGQWMNSAKSTYTYDANNNQTSYLYQAWDNLAWINRNKDYYSYDGKNFKTKALKQIWNGTTWVLNGKDSFSYDLNNNMSCKLSKVWNNNSWLNNTENKFTFDPNNFTKSETIKNWNITGNKVISGDSMYYYIHVVVGIINPIIQEESVSVYPNPNIGKFTINSKSTINSIDVYNLAGELLYSNCNHHRQTPIYIDLSNLEKGIYFARIQCCEKILTKKIIIQ
jgi:hypothetical protein